ncbi:MAG: LicD family protein [Candidatus Margulisiibacteriota bacterium]|jgi:hypothetical protein
MELPSTTKTKINFNKKFGPKAASSSASSGEKPEEDVIKREKLYPENLDSLLPLSMRTTRRYSLPHDDRGGGAQTGAVAAIAKVLYENQHFAQSLATRKLKKPIINMFSAKLNQRVDRFIGSALSGPGFAAPTSTSSTSTLSLLRTPVPSPRTEEKRKEAVPGLGALFPIPSSSPEPSLLSLSLLSPRPVTPSSGLALPSLRTPLPSLQPASEEKRKEAVPGLGALSPIPSPALEPSPSSLNVLTPRPVSPLSGLALPSPRRILVDPKLSPKDLALATSTEQVSPKKSSKSPPLTPSRKRSISAAGKLLSPTKPGGASGSGASTSTVSSPGEYEATSPPISQSRRKSSSISPISPRPFNPLSLPVIDFSRLGNLEPTPLSSLYMGYMYAYVKTLTSLFEKHRINYSLTGGALLGIARYSNLPFGEIHPWDDDVDFAIPKEERHKLYSPPFLHDLKARGLRIDPHPVFGDKIYSQTDLGFGVYTTKSPLNRYNFPRKSYVIPNIDLFTTRFNGGFIENSHSGARMKNKNKLIALDEMYPQQIRTLGPVSGVRIPGNPIPFLEKAYHDWQHVLAAKFSHVSGGMPFNVYVTNWGVPDPNRWNSQVLNYFPERRNSF